MSKLLDEIRKQPEHIRHMMMWLCVVITFSLVAFVWFRSTQAKFVALLHSEEIREEIDPRRFVERPNADVDRPASDVALVFDSKSPKTSYPFFPDIASGLISNIFSLLKASIVDLIGRSTNEFEINKGNTMKGNLNEGRTLPLSGDR